MNTTWRLDDAAPLDGFVQARLDGDSASGHLLFKVCHECETIQIRDIEVSPRGQGIGTATVMALIWTYPGYRVLTSLWRLEAYSFWSTIASRSGHTEILDSRFGEMMELYGCNEEHDADRGAIAVLNTMALA